MPAQKRDYFSINNNNNNNNTILFTVVICITPLAGVFALSYYILIHFSESDG